MGTRTAPISPLFSANPFFSKSILFLFGLILATTIAQGQAQPNLENGFKHYGSYDFHGLDTVNVMNGNLMLHAPMPLLPGYPQRGSLHPETVLYATSKGWQVQCIPASSGSGQACFWTAGGTSVAFEYSYGLRLHRTVDIAYTGGTGNTTYEAYGYTITEADGATHQFAGIAGSEDANGEPTKFESLDTSGYYLELNTVDSAGIANAATIIDRHGNQYLAGFGGYQHCDKPQSNIFSPGGHAMMITSGPVGDRYCSQTGWAKQVTDPNGNRLWFRVPGMTTDSTGSQPIVSDTIGRTWPLPSDGITSDYSGCISSYPISGAAFDNYIAPDGSTRAMKVCTAQIARQSFFNQPGIIEYQNYSTPQPLTAIVTVVLADGSKWTFDYDNYGMITRIGLPTGGSISYAWTTINFLNCNPTDHTGVSRAVASRTLNDNNGHSYTWSYNWGTAANGSLTNLVTDALGNDTVHTFTAQDGSSGCNFYETRTQTYQGSGGGRRLLKQVDTSYTSTAMTSDTQDFGSGLGNVKPKSVQTTLYPSGKVSLATYEYDPGLGNNAPSFGNVTVQKEYDWGAGQPGPLLRETDTTYQWQVDSSYLTAHLIDLPASVMVKDGSGCTLAKTTFGYDESGHLRTYPGTLPTGSHVAPPYGVRGNQTSVNRYLWIPQSGTTGSCAAVPAQPSVVSHASWYDTGEVYQQIDPLGHTTTHSYDPTYAGAYSTKTCNALSQCVSGTYDFNTGVLTSFTDANGSSMANGNTPGDAAHTSNYVYDYMFRLTSAQAPPDPNNSNMRAQTSFQYSAANSFPLSVQRQKSITSSMNDVSTAWFDGLARQYLMQHVTPNGTAQVDTVYDALDQVTSISNPYFTTSDSTYGVVQTTYDALGRVTRTQKQDNSVSAADYTDGNCTTTTDEAGKQRRACSDALGRLVSVDEPGDANATASSVPSSGGTQASGSVTISGAEQFPPDTGGGGGGGGVGGCSDNTMCGGTSGTAAYDTGTVWITVNGRTYTVAYGSSDTVSTIAANLASAINADVWAGVKATPSAGTINFTSVAAAGAANYSLSAGSTYDSANFPHPSFITSAAGMSGGTDGPPVFGGHAYTTFYSYDPLGDLIQVTQKGGTTDQSKSRIRASTYDSLSRLVTASNPESGTITYFYDNAGNLLQKVMPSPNQTGSAQHSVSYCYDALDRRNGKAYSWQNCQNGQLPTGTAVATYTYDQGSNGIGHLTSLTDQAGSASYSYDSLGRMASEQRTIGTVSKSMAYSYNLDNSIKTLTYPSNAVITYTPDAAGRMLSAVDSVNNINYVTAATYGPDNALTGFISGQSSGFVGITNAFSYNQRLQPVNMSASAPAQTVFSIGYDFHLGNGNNGNVYGITNYKDNNRNQAFTYDALNRLASAQNAGTDCSVHLPDGHTEYWGNSYVYDAWGNLLQKNVTKCSAENMTVMADAHNWIHTGATPDYGYDAAGNMTSDPTDGASMTYDAENLIATATKNGVTTTYTYDADGNRVKKASGTTATLYWYMAPGIVAESDSAGALKSEYIFLDGERVARKDFPGNAISYYFSDHLKTASVITDSAGHITDESDFYPWGSELQFASSGTNRYKFGGHEQDIESGLYNYGARHYSPSLSRFLTPDYSSIPVPVPYADLLDPQSLNLYGYAHNNPATLPDFDGHGCPPFCELAPPATSAPPAGGTQIVFDLEGPATLGLGLAEASLASEEIQDVHAYNSENIAYSQELQSIHQYNQAMLAKKNNNKPPTPAPQTQPKPPQTPPDPQMAEHRKGKRRSTKDKHEKKDSGTSKPPNYRPDRKYVQPKDDKKKDQEKPPYHRKDRDKK